MANGCRAPWTASRQTAYRVTMPPSAGRWARTSRRRKRRTSSGPRWNARSPLRQHLAHAGVQDEGQLVVRRPGDRPVKREVVLNALLEVGAFVLERLDRLVHGCDVGVTRTLGGKAGRGHLEDAAHLVDLRVVDAAAVDEVAHRLADGRLVDGDHT